MQEIYLIFKCAVAAFIYAEVLILPDHVLHGFFLFIEKLLTYHEIETLEVPEEIADDLPEGYEHKKRYVVKKRKLLKVLGGCTFCTAGQLTLWVVLFNLFFIHYLPDPLTLILCTIGNIIFYICLSILMVILLKKLQ